jgi:hypothetical protein
MEPGRFSASLRAGNATPGAPGTSRLTFSGIAGRTYTIEFNSTLNPDNWQPLASPVAGAQGAFEFLDTPPPGTVRHFYRARFSQGRATANQSGAGNGLLKQLPGSVPPVVRTEPARFSARPRRVCLIAG